MCESLGGGEWWVLASRGRAANKSRMHGWAGKMCYVRLLYATSASWPPWVGPFVHERPRQRNGGVHRPFCVLPGVVKKGRGIVVLGKTESEALKKTNVRSQGVPQLHRPSAVFLLLRYVTVRLQVRYAVR